MDIRLKPCTTKLQDDSLMLDRLSSLPVDLFIRILSILPTKDVAATCTLSRKFRRAFPWITSLDLSDSPVSNCLQHPHAIERFPSFVSFVETVLRRHQSPYLTSFRLHLGKDFPNTYLAFAKHRIGCEKGCFPDLKTTQINAWISFAITRIGLKQLDLRIHVREPGELPPAIFTCETLEVLKLDTNLGLDQASTMPSFRLPNLKLLHLYSTLINEDGFLPRLVSSCPLLEDLFVVANWNHVNYTHISSSSLRRLHLNIFKLGENEFQNTDFVLINTPNLEYLHYFDNLPMRISITNMSRLVEAKFYFKVATLSVVEDLQVLLSLSKALNNVQHLFFDGISTEVLDVGGIEDKLPLFHNLKYLVLVFSGLNCWDKIVSAFLNRSPVLETLFFPKGLITCSHMGGQIPFPEEKILEEQELFNKTLAVIPSCCRSHLKRIVIDYYYGEEREVRLIQFLLRHALVLEELVITKGPNAVAHNMALESTLLSLPRASATLFNSVQFKKKEDSFLGIFNLHIKR